MNKHKVMIGIEVFLLCMMVTILGGNAASSNPPSNGVSYNKNGQKTVQDALDNLYSNYNDKIKYGNATAGDILSGKTALVNGNKVTGSMRNASIKQGSEAGLNSNYPGIPVLYGTSPQLNTATDGTKIFSISPAEGYYPGGGGAYATIKQSTLASVIGLTANKIIKGNTILGITGTGTTGIDTSDANASASQILSGKTAYVKGSKVTGSMTNRGSLTNALSIGYGSGKAYFRIPTGAYLTTASSGYPEIVANVSALGITANKIVKGQSIAGVNGTAEVGYKYYKFDKDATYTRTSTGTATTLKSSSFVRMCADSKDCTYTFSTTLDVNVNKLYSCNVALRTAHSYVPSGVNSIVETKTPQARHTSNGFRVSRGTSGDTTNYWYLDTLTASKDFDMITTTSGPVGSGGSSTTSWGSYNRFGSNLDPTGKGHRIYTDCNVNGNKLTMDVTIQNILLQTYDSSFYLSGSIVYE